MSRDNRNEPPEGPRSEIDFARRIIGGPVMPSVLHNNPPTQEQDDTTPQQYDLLLDLLIRREAQLGQELERSVLKQRIMGQLDALSWVMQQIDTLQSELDEPIPLVPTQPPLPPIPPHVQEILDGLQRAGEDYHVSTSGAKVYVRRDGMWINATKTSNVTSTSTSTVKMQWETKDF